LLKGQLQKCQEDDHISKRHVAYMMEEVERVIDDQNTLLKKKEDEIDRLNTEVVDLKEEMEKTLTQQKTTDRFMKSTEVLDEILSHQRSPYDKYGMGYINENISTSSQQIYEERNQIHTGENKRTSQSVSQSLNSSVSDEVKNDISSSRNYAVRYETPFYGYCFSCNTFGHKAMDCKYYAKRKHRGTKNALK
jgi:uncharacterized protein YecA (UPF0149 family)